MNKYISILKKQYPKLFILCIFTFDEKVYAVLSKTNSSDETNVDSAGYIFDGQNFKLYPRFWNKMLTDEPFRKTYENALNTFNNKR